MSLTIITKVPRSRVRIGGECDQGGRRGFVLLACSLSPAEITPPTARTVERELLRFSEHVELAQNGVRPLRKT